MSEVFLQVILLFNLLKLTKSGNPIKHICDFSRGGLNARLRARIQTLLRGHKYALLGSLTSDSG